MAKQTFTTGQVLTAAQMTSLQQTAMGGGSATAKTASYVLVAADAGTTVAMNAAGATTITVNTGLFAAGDTVFIQNLGAGACTVTAGTATVATAGSLILPQNDAGILYFTATGTSIFYDYIQAGAASPLTTKGDLYTFSTSDARLAVGTNTHVLTADSAEATGLKWAAPASGGSLTLLSTTSLSTATTTVSITPTGYNHLQIFIQDWQLTGTGTVSARISGQTTDPQYTGWGGYVRAYNFENAATPISGGNIPFAQQTYQSGDKNNVAIFNIYNVNETNVWKLWNSIVAGSSTVSDDYSITYTNAGALAHSAAVSSFSFITTSTFSGGQMKIYGVK